ncbi:MAG TPA: transporter [Erysipelotrichaceae bacterium]|nr:transporter [Erysipelotrichaceae bacterium]
MLSLFGIFLGLGLLMYLAFKGYSIIWVAPLAAAVVALTGGLDIISTYMGPYMTGLVGFVKSWFPAFLLSAIFGNMMETTGAAKSIAIFLTHKLGSKLAIAAIVLSCAVLTIGGVSLFVVVFAIYPLALAMFKEANISRKLIPGAIALGAFTFTMTAVPGSPQIQNLIPMTYFGTTAMAAPIMGLTATFILFFGGVYYLNWKRNKLESQGEFYTEPDLAHMGKKDDGEKLPNILVALLPLVTVVTILNVLPYVVKFTEEQKAAGRSASEFIVYALLAGIALIFVLNVNKREKLMKSLAVGSQGALGAIMNTSAAVGFGTVVRAVPGFADLTNMLLAIPGNPLISLAVAVNLLAGATGSASGGMGIALAALGAKYMELAKTTGIDPQAFHRIASLASGGMDTLPHNGAVLTLLNNTGMTHKDSYFDIMVVSLILPIVASIPAIALAAMGIY